VVVERAGRHVVLRPGIARLIEASVRSQGKAGAAIATSDIDEAADDPILALETASFSYPGVAVLRRHLVRCT
jgi:hypothetical protein